MSRRGFRGRKSRPARAGGRDLLPADAPRILPYSRVGSAGGAPRDGKVWMGALAAELLELLVCPVPTCHAPLRQEGDRLVCGRCGLRYRIEESWPVLIPEEAEPPSAKARV